MIQILNHLCKCKGRMLMSCQNKKKENFNFKILPLDYEKSKDKNLYPN